MLDFFILHDVHKFFLMLLLFDKKQSFLIFSKKFQFSKNKEKFKNNVTKSNTCAVCQ